MAAAQMTCAPSCDGNRQKTRRRPSQETSETCSDSSLFCPFSSPTRSIPPQIWPGWLAHPKCCHALTRIDFVILFGIGPTAGPILFHYEPIGIALKWLTLSLVA